MCWSVHRAICRGQKQICNDQTTHSQQFLCSILHELLSPPPLARCYVAAQAECWSVHGPIWRGQRQRQPGQQPLSSPRSASEFVKYFLNNMIDGYQTAMCMLDVYALFFQSLEIHHWKWERSEKRRGQSRREIICTIHVVYKYKKSLFEKKSKYQ